MHHSKEPIDEIQSEFTQKAIKDLMQRQAAAQNLGATGEFPEGKISDSDEGEIQFGVLAYKGKVIINFGKPVHFIGMNPTQARELARTLRKYAEQAQHIKK